MDDIKLNSFAPAPLDLEDKSENQSPVFRPFAAWKEGNGVFLYLNERTLRINGEIVSPKIESARGSVLGPGDWWCFVYKRKPDSEADPYDVYDAAIAPKAAALTWDRNIVYCFRVIQVFDDLSFQQYAYGEVVISGLPEIKTNLTPFHISVLGYRDDIKTDVRYFLYAPQSPAGACAKYNGKPCKVLDRVVRIDDESSVDSESEDPIEYKTDFESEEEGIGDASDSWDSEDSSDLDDDYIEIYVDAHGKGVVYGYITSPNPAVPNPRYYLEIAQKDTSKVKYEVLATICIAEIGPDGDALPKLDDDESSESEESDESNESEESDELCESEEWGLDCERNWRGLTEFDYSENSESDSSDESDDGRMYRTLLRPFCITAFNSEKEPELSGRTAMFLPKFSVWLNSELVELETGEDTKGDFKMLSPGTWWCALIGDPDEENAAEDQTGGHVQAYTPDRDVRAKNVSAKIVKSDEYPYEDGLFFAFKIAEVYSEWFGQGSFQEFTYGEVNIASESRGIHHIVPFEIMTVTRVDRQLLQVRDYYCYTPPGNTLFFNGKSVGIEGAQGVWTKLEVGNEAIDFGVDVWCYKVSKDSEKDDEEDKKNAKLTTNKKEAMTAKTDFVFPVAHIGPERDVDSTARAVIVAVEHSKRAGEATGAYYDAQRMSALFARHVGEGVVLISEEATKEAVLDAMKWATRPGTEVGVIYISSHGGCDDWGNNTLSLYDAELTDAEVWSIIRKAACPVFLIFDACQSGTMYRPPEMQPRNVERRQKSNWATALKAMATRDNPGVNMLCWAAATDMRAAYSNVSTGGFFTTAIVEHMQEGMLYKSIFAKVKNQLANREPPQVPQETEYGDFWYDQKFFLNTTQPLQAERRTRSSSLT